MAKRQRKYRLEVQNKYGDTVVIEPPFSVSFDIEKRVFANISQGSLTIFNLGETLRSELFKDLLQVDIDQMRAIVFYAGYETDIELPRIFAGTISRCYSMRQGVDFHTVIEFNSGSDFLANSYVSLSASKGTLIRDLMDQIAQGINPEFKRSIGSFAGELRRGVTYEGSAVKLIQDYSNGNFFIDDNNIVIINDDEALNGIINQIDSDSGLLGSPLREESFLVFDMIFEPRILLAQQISLVSSTVPFFNGIYKVVGFHHTGMISETVCGDAKTQVRVQFFPDGVQLIS